MPFAQNFYVLLAMVVALGIGDGIILCFIVPIACSLVGSAKLSNQATGYYHLIMAPGAMGKYLFFDFKINLVTYWVKCLKIVGAIFAGWSYDYFLTYDLAFYTGGATCIVCALIILLIEFMPEEDREAKSIDIDTEEPKNSLLL